jgi:hypothetical protein
MRLLMLTVNTVSLYLERGQETFHSIHVEAAEQVAAQAQRHGVKRFIHVSGLAPMLARNRCISESAVRANWRFGKPMAMPF